MSKHALGLARLVRGVRGGRCYRGFALALIRSVSRRGWLAVAAVALAACSTVVTHT